MRPRLAITASLLLVPLLCSADTGWVTVAPDGAGFSAEFPVSPSTQVSSGKGYNTTIWLAKALDGNMMVLTGVTDYWSHIDTDQELELDQKNFLSSMGGTATSSQRSTFPAPKATLPAVSFDFVVPGAWNGRSRVIVYGDTVYQYALLWRQGYDASAAVELFEKSFKLLPRVRPAPPAATGN